MKKFFLLSAVLLFSSAVFACPRTVCRNEAVDTETVSIAQILRSAAATIQINYSK